MPNRLRSFRKGIISTWFFCIFLFCYSLTLYALENDIRMMKTMSNLKTAEMYLEAECEVIHDIQCRMASHEELNGTFHTASFAYTLYEEENSLTVYIDEPDEILCVEIQNGRVFDYTASRSTEDVFH